MQFRNKYTNNTLVIYFRLEKVIYFFQAGTVTNPAIWLVLSAVRIFLSLTTVTVTLAWVFSVSFFRFTTWKKMYKLFTGLVSVRIVKNWDLGHSFSLYGSPNRQITYIHVLPTHTVIYRDGISEGPICNLCNVEGQTLHRLLINCTLTLNSTRGYVLNFQNFLWLIHGKLEILKEIVTAKKAFRKFYRT